MSGYGKAKYGPWIGAIWLVGADDSCGSSSDVLTIFFERVQYKFNAARNSQLLVNLEEVIAHRVFGQAQFLRRFAVAEAFDKELHHIFLALGQQPAP